MGRIKSKMIKNAANQLLEKQHSFNEDFENNKKRLSNTMPSKSIRNKIAGYLARIIKMERVTKEKPQKVVVEQAQEKN